VKFHLSITEEDYIAFNIDHAFHSASARKTITIGRFLPALVSACFLMIFLLSGMDQKYLIAEITMLGVLSIVGYFRYPDVYKKSIRKNILKLKAEGRLPYSPETDIEFTETEIIETAPDRVSHTPYSSVLAIRETDEQIFIKFGAMQSFILPIRCLGERKQELLDFLHEKCDNVQQ